jgi:hypothetical protein
MKSSEKIPLTKTVYVDEFEIGISQKGNLQEVNMNLKLEFYLLLKLEIINQLEHMLKLLKILAVNH